MIKETYYLIVSSTFDREPIRFPLYPTDKEIENALTQHNCGSARVEKRYEKVVFPTLEKNDLEMQRLKKNKKSSFSIIGNGIVNSRDTKCTNCGSVFQEFGEVVISMDEVVPCCPICKANMLEYEMIPLDEKGNRVK